MPKLLIAAGVALIALGLLWTAGERFGLSLGRLPSDIVVERGSLRVYMPITTSSLLSATLSLVYWLSVASSRVLGKLTGFRELRPSLLLVARMISCARKAH